MVDQKDIDILQEINKELAKQVEFESKIARIRGEEKTELQSKIDLLVKQREVQQNIESILAETNRDVRMASLELMEKEADRSLERGKITSTAYKNQIELVNELRKVTNDASNESFKDLEKRLKKQEKMNKALEKQTKAMVAGTKAGAGMAAGMAKIVGIADEQNTVFGELIQSINVFDKGFKGAMSGAGATLKGFGQQFKKNFNLATAAAFAFNNQFEVAMNFDMMLKGMMQSTGATDKLEDTIIGTNKTLQRFGITLENSTNAAGALYAEFALLSSTSPRTRQELNDVVASLENVGISASQSTRFLSIAVTQLNTSLPEAIEQLKEFAVVGMELQIPTGELLDTMTNMTPQLSIFGNKQKQVFMDAVKFSKGLGLNVNEGTSAIMKMGGAMRDFQSSAQVAADFNVIFGESMVNAFDLTMVRAKGGPLAQLEMIRDSFEQTGKSLDDLGFFEKEMLEQRFGINYGLLERLMSGEVLTEDDIKEANVSLEDRLLANAQITDKLRATTEASTLGLKETRKTINAAATKVQSLIEAMGGLEIAMFVLAGASAIGSIADFAKIFTRGGIGKGLAGSLPKTAKPTTKGFGAAASTLSALGRRGSPTPTGPPGRPMRRFARGRSRPPRPGTPSGSVLKAPTPTTAATKTGAKFGLGTAGKIGAKAIPGLGLALSLGFMGSRLMEGDFLGAGGELASGLVGLIPGLGTAASLGIQGLLTARDMGAFEDEVQPMQAAKATSPKPIASVNQTQISTRAATENAMLRQEISMLRKSLDNNAQAQASSKQPIKVDLYLDRSGTKKIAEASLDVLNSKYLSRGRVSNV